jgi:hypothetical protein
MAKQMTVTELDANSRNFGYATFSDGRTLTFIKLPEQVGGGYRFREPGGKRRDGYTDMPMFQSPKRQAALQAALEANG